MALGAKPGIGAVGGYPSSPIARPKSSASTPSLRSREGKIVDMVKRAEGSPSGRSTPTLGGEGGGGTGNVKVVVRVRGFLPRGELIEGIGSGCCADTRVQRLREERNVSSR
jgi:hypothetical protein